MNVLRKRRARDDSHDLRILLFYTQAPFYRVHRRRFTEYRLTNRSGRSTETGRIIEVVLEEEEGRAG